MEICAACGAVQDPSSVGCTCSTTLSSGSSGSSGSGSLDLALELDLDRGTEHSRTSKRPPQAAAPVAAAPASLSAPILAAGPKQWRWDLGWQEVLFDVDPEGVESVRVDGRLVSRSPRGGNPGGGGHIFVVQPRAHQQQQQAMYREVAARDASVAFDPYQEICTLKLGGVDVAPTSQPARAQSATRGAPFVGSARPHPVRSESTAASGSHGSPWVLKFVITLLAIVGFGTVVMLAGRRVVQLMICGPTSNQEAGLCSEARNKGSSEKPKLARSDGNITPTSAAYPLMVLHFPASYTPAGQNDAWSAEVNEVLLKDADDNERFYFGAVLHPQTTDIWTLNHLIQRHDGELEKKLGGVFEDLDRSEGTCLGEKAAIVLTHIRTNKGVSMKRWMCSFAHEGRAYRFGYLFADGSEAEEPALRKIIEATELRRPPSFQSAGRPAP